MVDSEEVIETFYDEELKAGGCEYMRYLKWECDGERRISAARHHAVLWPKERTYLGDWIIEYNTFRLLLRLRGRRNERMLFASLLIIQTTQSKQFALSRRLEEATASNVPPTRAAYSTRCYSLPAGSPPARWQLPAV